MNQNQDQKKREAEAKKRLIDAAKQEISLLIGRVPESHSSWSYQKAVAFKACVALAHRVMASERTTVECAQMAASKLRSYFK